MAEKQLTAQEERAIEEFLAELKNREQPQVVSVPPNTAVKFLMARKFDVSRAIDLFQAYRNTRLKEGIYNINPDEEPLRSELLSGKFTVLPGRDANGAALALFTARLHRPDVTTHKAVLQAIIYQLDKAIERVETQRNGLIFIYDMINSTYGNFDYELCVKILNLLKGAFPARLKCVFIVSSPLWFRAPFAVLRLFVREKLRERVRTVKAHELVNHIPKESLPEHLGGTSKISHVAWIQACVNSRQGQENGDCMDHLFVIYTTEQSPVSDRLNSNCSQQNVTDNTRLIHNHYHENRTKNLAEAHRVGGCVHWNGSAVPGNYDCCEKSSSANTNCRRPPPQSETPPDTPLYKQPADNPSIPPLPQKSRPLPAVMELSIHMPEDGGMTVLGLVQHVKRMKKRGIFQEYEEIRKEPPVGTFDVSNSRYLMQFLCSYSCGHRALIPPSWSLSDRLSRHMHICGLLEVILQGSGSAPPVPPCTKSEVAVLLLGCCPPTASSTSPDVLACLLVAPPRSGHYADRHSKPSCHRSH